MTTILIIEDEIRLRETISELFSISGYLVFQADNGLEGLKKVDEILPDLIICDIMMPKLDGYGFIEQLKNTNYANIPVIFLTAKTELINQQRGLSLGAKAYVIKPFNFNELKNTVENILLMEKDDKL